MTYEEAIRSKTKERIYRIEFLDELENPNDAVTSGLQSGSINVSYNDGVRRQGTLTFINNDGKFNIFGNLLNYKTRLKIFTGIKVFENGVAQEFLYEQGVFVITFPFTILPSMVFNSITGFPILK